MEQIDVNAIYDQALYWVNMLAPLVTYIVAGVFGIIKVIGYVKSIGSTVTDNSKTTDEKIEALTSSTTQIIEQNRALIQDNANLRKEVKRLSNNIQKIEE